MKMEFGGTGNRKGYLKAYSPGEMPEALEKQLEDFLFPASDFPEEYARRTEIHISNQYKKQSVIFIYFLDHKCDCILSTCRIISKKYPWEKIPIESSTIVSMSPAFNQSNNTSLSVSELFDVNRIPNALPSCEIGGLRACECDPKKGITLKQRYLALSTVLHASETEALKCGYRIGFLTCIGTPTLQRLYQDRFGFNEVAEVSYGGSVTWKALCRLR